MLILLQRKISFVYKDMGTSKMSENGFKNCCQLSRYDRLEFVSETTDNLDIAVDVVAELK